ncbi:hypothetical protein [Marinigracilibium pacificum]|uniref:Uncharacterized protein n=1 Tax=Marinigracilibium pacificum TaxID=2729599 RepID=A0A848JCM6_9BACT|nr:hypothetical protein [Marinigracilibium pacificum]NMM50752.1 hypothetical protein [Marinigracilibium pacificum]
MNTNFIETLEEQYLNYIDNSSDINGEVKNIIKSVLKEGNLESRNKLFFEQSDLIKNNKESAINISNPLFIGYGNPNSDLLIIGKEKAFNPEKNPELLLHESINNLTQWKNIISTGVNIGEFDPRNPRIYHNKGLSSGHTWRLYSKIISSYSGDFNTHSELLNSTDINDSMFNNCFITELNYKPSKKTLKSAGNLEYRKALFQTDFFKSFKKVLFTAKAYVGKKTIEEYFNCKYSRSIQLQGNTKRHQGDIYTREDSEFKLLSINQLSGSNYWEDETLKKIAIEIKNS